jgi:hypothetical protein
VSALGLDNICTSRRIATTETNFYDLPEIATSKPYQNPTSSFENCGVGISSWCIQMGRDVIQSSLFQFLATFFSLEISGLADSFLMEIEENVNSGQQTSSFKRYLLRTDKICSLR